MDWKSKRISTILEAALAEDKVANDVTTALTIDRGLRASGTIVAKQACVISGLGCIPVFLDIFAKMSTVPPGRFEVVSHPEIFDGVKVKKGQTIARAGSSGGAASPRLHFEIRRGGSQTIDPVSMLPSQ